MSNPDHLDVLKNGVDAWNAWRRSDPLIKPDLSGAQLEGTDLSWAHLEGTDLRGAILRGAILSNANLAGAHLDDANLFGSRLGEANLAGACLRGAKLTEANLYGANVQCANLEYANLSNAQLLAADLTKAYLYRCNLEFANLAGAKLAGTNLTRASLVGCCIVGTEVEGCIFRENYVFGVSVWNVRGKPALQANLIVTLPLESAATYPDALAPHSISVDSLEVAQFIHAILAGENLRKLIDAASSKVVLLLGRFTPDRKPLLEALKNALASRNYVPVIYDFDGPESRDRTETVTLLARLARFIVVDLTAASSVPQELQAIVPHVEIPIQPILVEGRPWSMFRDLSKYHWLLPIYRGTGNDILSCLDECVIAPAEEKWRELARLRSARFVHEVTGSAACDLHVGTALDPKSGFHPPIEPHAVGEDAMPRASRRPWWKFW